VFAFVQRCEEMLLHGSLGQRFAVLWLLLGVAATCIATVSALWQLGLRGAVRYFFSDWQSILERRRRNELRPVQRWGLLFLCLGMGWFGLLTLLQIFDPHGADDPRFVWILMLWGPVGGLILLGFPVVWHLERHVDQHRFNHIIECHPLAATLLWYRGIGPRPLPSSYRRRCERWLCLFR